MPTTTRTKKDQDVKVTKTDNPDDGTLVEKSGAAAKLPEPKDPKRVNVDSTMHVAPSDAQLKTLFNQIPKERREEIEAEFKVPFPLPDNERQNLLEEAYVQHVAADSYESMQDYDQAGAKRQYRDDILAELGKLHRRAEQSVVGRHR